MRRRAARLVLDAVLRPALRRLGLYLLTTGYSTPIPNVRELERRGHWDRPASMAGIDLRPKAQLEFAAGPVSFFSVEPPFSQARLHDPDRSRFRLGNGIFDDVDAAALYAFVRHLQPTFVIESGIGHSTKLINEALARNALEGGPRPSHTSIDPFPPSHLDARPLQGHTLLPVAVQDVDLDVFSKLGPGDILFIDSSHVAKAGSDVNWLFLEVVPRLRPGVYIHVHDIFLPYEYAKEWFGRPYQFWSEQYLLHALLALNDSFQVEWMSHFLHRQYPDQLSAAVPFYRPAEHCPASFWFQKVR